MHLEYLEIYLIFLILISIFFKIYNTLLYIKTEKDN